MEKTTVAGAQAAAGFPVPVSSHPAASPANLTQAWVNTHDGEVALVFDKGKVDITMARATYQSALSYFHAFVAKKNKNRVTAMIGQVKGRPALVITPNTNAYTNSNPGVVNFERNVSLSAYTAILMGRVPCSPLPTAYSSFHQCGQRAGPLHRAARWDMQNAEPLQGSGP